MYTTQNYNALSVQHLDGDNDPAIEIFERQENEDFADFVLRVVTQIKDEGFKLMDVKGTMHNFNPFAEIQQAESKAVGEQAIAVL